MDITDTNLETSLHKMEEETILLLDEENENASSESDETEIKMPITNISEPTHSIYTLLLPPGKRFHLFISHTELDSGFAFELMEELENRFGFKCMYADRDFVAGKEIAENINEKILESQRMLLILTPEFNKRYFCRQEMNHALLAAQEENRFNTIIPLVLRLDEEGLPTSLRSCTYIDAKKETDIALKIHEIYCMLDENEHKRVNLQLELTDPNEIRKQNGARILTVSAEKYIRKPIFGIRWNFKKLSDFQVQHLGAEQMGVCELYQEIANELNKCLLLRLYGILKFGWRAVMLGILVGLFLFFLEWGLAFLLIILTSKMNIILLTSAYYISSIFILVLMIFLGILLSRIAERKLLQRVDKKIWNFNKRNLKGSPYLVTFDKSVTFDPRISIITYDTRECEHYVSILLKSENKGMSDYEIEAKTRILFDNLLWEKRRELFLWEKLPVATSLRHQVTRHRTWLNKMCLCDLIKHSFTFTKSFGNETITV